MKTVRKTTGKVLLAASFAPMLSTMVLGIDCCMPLAYASTGFAILIAVGVGAVTSGILLPSEIKQGQKVAATVPVAGPGVGILVVSALGLAASLIAGLGVIQQQALGQTVSGQLFMLAGTAPVDLNQGYIVGIDFAFIAAGVVLCYLLNRECQGCVNNKDFSSFGK